MLNQNQNLNQSVSQTNTIIHPPETTSTNTQPKETKEFLISYSKLSDYARCGLYYYFKHIEKIPTPQTTIKLFGIVSHKSLEKFFLEKKLLNQNPKLEFLLGTFEEELDKQLLHPPEPTPLLDENLEEISQEKARSLLLSSGIAALKEFYNQKACNIEPFLVEQEFYLDITNLLHELNTQKQQTPTEHENGHKTILVGYIDLLDRNLVLYDYKFRKRKPYSTSNEAEKSHQLAVYAYAVKEIIGDYPKKTVIENIVSDHRGVSIITHEHVKTQDEIERIFKRTARLINALKKKVFLPADSSSWACNYCIYKVLNICKEYV